MATQNIYSLAKSLGASNIIDNYFIKNPIGRSYLQARRRAQDAQKTLESSETPLGAISSGIALYLQRKRENKALEEFNRAYEEEQAQEAQRIQAREQQRESLLSTLPEDKRQLAGFLDDAGLQKYVAETLSPQQSSRQPATIQEYEYFNQLTPEQKKSFINLKRDTEEPKSILAQENIRLKNEKLRKEIKGVGKPSIGKPPAGYRFTESGDLEAIAGGPATKQSAESAGKIALIKQGLSDVSDLEKMLKDPDGSFDRSKLLGLRTIGRPGARDEYSKLYNALNARLRLESGAAVPESEVERAFETFAPSFLDSDTTIKSKIKRMREFFSSAEKEIGQGRGAEPISQKGNEGIFKSSSGVKFTIKR